MEAAMIMSELPAMPAAPGAGSAAAEGSGVSCGICHNDSLREVGELEVCFHRFCFPCIVHWSQIESRCPFCKARFASIVQKQLSECARTSLDPGQTPLDGTILQVLDVPERDQASVEADPLAHVHCLRCGGGEDDHLLLLCDGCDRAMHTFCAGLSEVPEGQWYCPDCAAAAEREDPTAAPASSTAAVGAGDEDAWPELNVADFSDIEELDEPEEGSRDQEPAPTTREDRPLAGVLTQQNRERRRLARGSQRTVRGARGAANDIRQRVMGAIASEPLPTIAHRQVQAMRDSFQARREEDRRREEAAAASAAFATAGRSGRAPSAGGCGGGSISRALRSSGPATPRSPRSEFAARAAVELVYGSTRGGDGISTGVITQVEGMSAQSAGAAFRAQLARGKASDGAVGAGVTNAEGLTADHEDGISRPRQTPAFKRPMSKGRGPPPLIESPAKRQRGSHLDALSADTGVLPSPPRGASGTLNSASKAAAADDPFMHLSAQQQQQQATKRSGSGRGPSVVSARTGKVVGLKGKSSGGRKPQAPPGQAITAFFKPKG
mmetsp:Transcript_8248/g.24625  ORF Transcript_8248/g.24625 Transcript_8248/m.24625 type:complete len:552 (-) Transcript_8248:3183-4838(-)